MPGDLIRGFCHHVATAPPLTTLIGGTWLVVGWWLVAPSFSGRRLGFEGATDWLCLRCLGGSLSACDHPWYEHCVEPWSPKRDQLATHFAQPCCLFKKQQASKLDIPTLLRKRPGGLTISLVGLNVTFGFNIQQGKGGQTEGIGGSKQKRAGRSRNGSPSTNI